MGGGALHKIGEQLVSLDACGISCMYRQEYAEGQEEEVGRHKGNTVGTHILLGILQRLAGEVLLHHILIKTGHDDGNEDSTEELLPEMMGRRPVIEHEDAAHRTVGNGTDGLTDGEVQQADGFEDDQYQCSEQAEGLEGVGEDQRANATATGVEPDEQHHNHHVYYEGYACRVEHELL